jgi:hypothetical protein
MYLVYVISLEMKNTEEPRLGCETDFSLLWQKPERTK